MCFDAGTLCLQGTDAFQLQGPRSLFSPLDFGLVGFSFACGLGVKLAMPDRPVISMMGDGGFGMTVSELSTAVDHGINTVTIVMNNGCWGAEKAYQRDFFNGAMSGRMCPARPLTSWLNFMVPRAFMPKSWLMSQVRSRRRWPRAGLRW